MYIEVASVKSVQEVCVDLGECNDRDTKLIKSSFETYEMDGHTYVDIEIRVCYPTPVEEEHTCTLEMEEDEDGEDVEAAESPVPPEPYGESRNPRVVGKRPPGGPDGFHNNWVRSYTEF